MKAVFVFILCCVALANAFNVGDYVCISPGLNLRNGACGGITRGSTGQEAGRITEVKRTTCSLGTYTWVKVDNFWAAVETGLVKKCAAPSAGINVGDTVCISPGLNLRNGPCGGIVRGSGSESGKVTEVRRQSCSLGDFTWVKVNNVWGAVETGLVNKCSGPAPVPGGALISSAQLRCVMPRLSVAQADGFITPLNNAMKEGGITSKICIRAFLAQIAHESGQLQWWEELGGAAVCNKYNNRKDLCNGPTDGCRYKGRGPIQLTGRCNYQAAGNALGLNLIANPEIVSTRDVGFRTTIWYWRSRNLNNFCGDFRELTRRINGGYNGYDDRVAYLNRANSCI